MKNTTLNRNAIKTIADALGDLNDEVVFVGGAIVSLYIDNPAAEDVRATKDIDITFEIASLSKLESLREDLARKGFTQSHEDTVICRFRYGVIEVDVMTTEEIGWAPANPWFKPGFEKAQQIDIDGTKIRILTLPYFLATKFTAFHDRGGKDPRASHDFEDIVYLLNHTSNMKELILQSDPGVQDYLKTEFQQILYKSELQEAIRGNLEYENQDARFNKIMTTLKEITDAL